MIRPRNMAAPNGVIPSQDWGNLQWWGGAGIDHNSLTDNATHILKYVIPYNFKVMGILYVPYISDAGGTGLDFEIQFRKANHTGSGFAADWSQLSVNLGNTEGAFVDLSEAPLESAYNPAAAGNWTLMLIRNEGLMTAPVGQITFMMGVKPIE